MGSEFLVRQDVSGGSVARVEAVLSRMRQSESVAATLGDLGLHADSAAVGRSSDGAYLLYEVDDTGCDPASIYRDALDAAGVESGVGAGSTEGEESVGALLREFDAVTDGDPYAADFREFDPACGSGATAQADD